MFRLSREKSLSFSCAAYLVHLETLTKNFLSSENLNQFRSIIHFLIGVFNKAANRRHINLQPVLTSFVFLFWYFVPPSFDFAGVNNKNNNNSILHTK